MNENKLPDITRLYFANVNGLKLDKGTSGELQELCHQMSTIQADIICIAETHLDTEYKDTLGKIHQSVKKAFFPAKSRVQCASSRISYGREWKPGGTALITRGSIVGRHCASGSDEYGRWAWTQLAAQGHRVLIISCYQVCVGTATHNRTTTAKPNRTAATQQQTMFTRKGILGTTPRREFIKDLTEFISHMCPTNRGDKIVLVGDFNETMESPNSGIRTVAEEFGLVDILATRVGHTSFNTYNRGTTRIDFALCSPEVVAAVTKGGYEPFGYRPKGDHRPFYLDFNTISLFGNPTHQLASPSSRHISSNDLPNRKIYIEARHQYCVHHKLFSRINDLLSQPFTRDDSTRHPDIIQQIESIDRDWVRSAIHAEQMCSIRPTTPFVIQIVKIRRRKGILQKLLTMSLTQTDMSEGILRLQEEGLTDRQPYPTEPRELRNEIENLKRQLRKLERNPEVLRRQELKAKLEEYRASKNSKMVKKMRHLIAGEEMKEVTRRIRNLTPNDESKGITRIEVPENPNEDPKAKTTTQWKTVETPSEVVAYLQERNQKPFGQAHGTFPTTPVFQSHVDWAASTYECEAILEGTFDTDCYDDIASLMMKHMEKSTSLDSISAEVTETQWVGKMKSWRETTSTSPSGMHLGHHKTLTTPFPPPTPKENDQTVANPSQIQGTNSPWHRPVPNTASPTTADTSDDQQPEGPSVEEMRVCLLQAQLDILNFCINHSYPLQRWKKVVNVMIHKEPGNNKIHRLRVLHLFEADLSALLAIKWRALMHHAVDNHLIHPEQYGGVPGRDSITPAYIEELLWEITRATRQKLVAADFDATSCYDMIIHV